MDAPDPDEETIGELAEEFDFELSESDRRFYANRIDRSLSIFEITETYDTSEVEPPEGPVAKRTSTAPEDDRLNAWRCRCNIQRTDHGRLANWTVAVKDGINVAGLESASGSKVFEGTVPSYDATVVRRLLDAGARITGKANMDDMGNSGDGSSCAFGPVLNPVDQNHLSGGSSGGSAAAVADGQVDVALGTDSGGSVRAPASWCGVVGHKPTHGLVPYTGISGLERTTDHVGPIAPTVAEAAELLTVIAGPDDYDARQPRSVPDIDFAASIANVPNDLSVGVLEEGFTRLGADERTNEIVHKALSTLSERYADVSDVSIPIHEDAQTIQGASVVLGMYASYQSNAEAYSHQGWYDTNRMETFHNQMRERADAVPASVRNSFLLGAYASQEIPNPGLYGELMNLRRLLRRRYDEALDEYDVLALPTTPMPAYEYDADSTRADWLDRSLVNLSNTAPFNATGHPAISVPVGTADGLPVGLQLVGNHFDDKGVLQAAAAVEKAVEENA